MDYQGQTGKESEYSYSNRAGHEGSHIAFPNVTIDTIYEGWKQEQTKQHWICHKWQQLLHSSFSSCITDKGLKFFRR